MADAQGLGDFFKSKSKKKIKASNLNKDTATAKPEEKKSSKKSAEDDAWEEEEIKAATIKGVESAGTLKKEEDTKDDGDSAAPAWGALKAQKENTLNDKKFPTLAKAVGSTSIALEQEEKINIGTSKNVFAALKGQEDSDEEDGKAPKSIKPALVSKKKGERENVAVARAVKDAKDLKKAHAKKDDDDDDEDEEEDEDAEEDETEEVKQEAKDEVRRTKEKEKKDKAKAEKEMKKTQQVVEEEDDEEDDVKMEADTATSKAKYAGRRKRLSKDVPREELEEEKENRPVQAQQTGGKKKKFVVKEEEKKLAFVPDDW